jgi:uncharacterized protein (UPF0332 family)
MSLHSDLLAQAQHLLGREPRRPKQASLRRAVSAGYYALFHMLIDEAAKMLIRETALRKLVARTFVHSEMNKASKSFAGGNLPQKFGAVTGGAAVPVRLRAVSKAFVDLQQARHEADYNLARSFTRSEATDLVNQVSQAFQDWQAIRSDVYARRYLVCLLLWDKWDKMQ